MLRFATWINHITREVLVDPLRRMQLSVFVLISLNLIGTAAYMLLEGWSFGDSLYMTVITIATVGFGEVGELSEAGRFFTILLIYVGIGAATSAITNAVSLAAGPVLWGSLRERRLRAVVENIENHYIVCGYGRMGRQIIRDLQARDEPFVLVDKSQEITSMLVEMGIPHVIGDATQDDVLYEAGIQRAKGLVAALSSDAGNIMTVLTARELNPRLFIVARVVRVETESKLRRAGANRVINPYQIGGHRIALSLMRPAVHDFLEQLFHFGTGHQIDIGQIHVLPNSELDGQTIATCNLRETHNVTVLAIREPNGRLHISPAPTTRFKPHAELIVIGSPEAIYELERTRL